MPNQTIDMNNVNSVSFNNNTVNEIYLNNDKIWPVGEEYFLTFSSPNSFTLSVVDNTKYWNGTLETSTDKTNWTTWSGTSAVSSASNGTKHNLYVRGIGNTYITGQNATTSKGAWRLNGSNISISGILATLLDYARIEQGLSPSVSSSVFRALFAHPSTSLNTSIIDISKIIIGRHAMMAYSYLQAFRGLSAITKPPVLPFTQMNDGCYSNMFRDCTSLIYVPKLLAKQLQLDCYSNMFYNCTSLYVSDTQTAQASHAWKIPTNNNIIGTTYSQTNMFYHCLGTRSSSTFAGTTGSQFTYYTQNEPV